MKKLDISKDEKGSELAKSICFGSTLLTLIPVSIATAYFGGIGGKTLGEEIGKIVNSIPIYRDYLPYTIEKSGFNQYLREGLSKSEMNVEIRKFEGKVIGEITGLFMPYYLSFKLFYRKKHKFKK